MFSQCLWHAVVLAVTAVLSSGQNVGEWRAINSTGSWSKYNLIAKPTAAVSSETVPPTVTTVIPSDADARHKLTIVKTKYGYKDQDQVYVRPYISTHKYHSVSDSEEQNPEYDREPDDDDDDDDDELEEENEDSEDAAGEDDPDQEEALTSEEQEAEHHRSTTQRSQSIHHKAPVKVASLDSSTVRSTGSRQKIRKGNPSGTHFGSNYLKPSIQPIVVHDADDTNNIGDEKGQKAKGVKKYKVKGLKKLKKYLLPLLLAYKLKFFTLIPLLLGGLVLIVASTGFAGFFFALFAVGVGLKKD